MNTQRIIKLCSVVGACFFFIVAFTDEGSTREGEVNYISIQHPRYQQSDRKNIHNHQQMKKSQPPRYQQEKKVQERRGSYFKEHGYRHLNIPERHYPRQGECRVWYPNRHRSSRIRCGQKPPRGAWLLQRHKNRPHNVYVEVYEPRQQGILFTLGEFEIITGAFVREMPRR